MKYFQFLFLLFTISVFPQRIVYEISFPNLVHHEAEIKVKFSDLKTDTLKLRMSRTSPGRYALHEFAKNLYNVKAINEDGKNLNLVSKDLHQWVITGHSGTVIFSYTLFGNRGDGTYSQINTEHIHLNVPSAFVYSEQLPEIPIEINFDLPDEKDWKIATQLKPGSGSNSFTAPDYYYFFDSPVEIADLIFREWDVESNGKNYTIRLAIHQTEDEAVVNAYQKLVEACVLETKEIMGGFPEFDFGSYTFLCDYVPFASGDGMEHRNSTFCTSTRKISSSSDALINTVAHEFFHCWNVERMRPGTLEPFNFNDVNVSDELWFAEGFTEYYKTIITTRAGIHSIDSFSELITRYVNDVINSPATKFFSPVEMSRQAPFVDAAVSIDPQNKQNTFLSYYTWGAALGLALDLTLRKEFSLSLDDYLKLLWKKFGKTEIPYTNNDLKNSLTDLTGSAGFANSFFENYIFGKEIPDFNKLLSFAGLTIKKSFEGEASIGKISLEERNGKLYIDSPALIGSPVYKAGIDLNDRIIRIGSFAINSIDDFYNALSNFSPGENAIIEFEKLGEIKTSEITFEEDKLIEVVPFEHQSLALTPDIETFRKNWLGSKSTDLPELVKHCPACKRELPFQYEACPYDKTELGLIKQ